MTSKWSVHRGQSLMSIGWLGKGPYREQVRNGDWSPFGRKAVHLFLQENVGLAGVCVPFQEPQIGERRRGDHLPPPECPQRPPTPVPRGGRRQADRHARNRDGPASPRERARVERPPRDHPSSPRPFAGSAPPSPSPSPSSSSPKPLAQAWKLSPRIEGDCDEGIRRRVVFKNCRAPS